MSSSLSIRSIIIATILISLSISSPSYSAAQAPDNEAAEDAIKPLVVMMTTEWRNPDARQDGAGIIVGQREGRIYIATANHLVRRESSDDSRVDATKILVEFKWLPGELIEGKLLKDSSTELDLAMIVVPGVSLPNSVKFDKLGDPTLLRRSDNVYTCGNPHQQKWRIYVSPSRMSEAAGSSSLLHFESSNVMPGNSGGTLLNDRFLIVGMMREKDPPDGEALNIRNVLDAIRRWDYPIDLTLPNAVTSFHFFYKFGENPGEHYWQKVDDNTWVERYPTGEQAYMHITGRTSIEGDQGTLVEHTKINYLEYFIPDKGSRRMWLRIRQKGQDNWSSFLGEMVDVK